MEPNLVAGGCVTNMRGKGKKLNFMLLAKKNEIKANMAAMVIKYQNLMPVIRCSPRDEYSLDPL